MRKYLRFFPEDANGVFGEAYHGQRWLKEIDEDLATPMIHQYGQDFYVLEPTALRTGDFCIPARFFTRPGQGLFAQAWRLEDCHSSLGWIVHKDQTIIVAVSELTASFPYLCSSFTSRNISNPCNILGTNLKKIILLMILTILKGLLKHQMV